MPRVVRAAVALAVFAAAESGCGPTKSDGEPNPALVKPDIPPGRGADGSGPPAAPKKK